MHSNGHTYNLSNVKSRMEISGSTAALGRVADESTPLGEKGDSVSTKTIFHTVYTEKEIIVLISRLLDSKTSAYGHIATKSRQASPLVPIPWLQLLRRNDVPWIAS